MVKFSAEDAASMDAVIGMLDNEAATLGRDSDVAGVWRDWADLLKPTAAEMAPVT
jgi:hypothetical protein